MSELDIASWSLFAALFALCLSVAALWRTTRFGDHHSLRRQFEEHLDDFADHRDKVRHWINRDRTRVAREVQGNGSRSVPAGADTPAQSDQEVKANLRRLDRVSRGLEAP